MNPALVAELRSPAAKRGAVLFTSAACIACHQIDGVGGNRGPGLDNVIHDFNADPPRIYTQILVGGKGTATRPCLPSAPF